MGIKGIDKQRICRRYHNKTKFGTTNVVVLNGITFGAGISVGIGNHTQNIVLQKSPLPGLDSA